MAERPLEADSVARGARDDGGGLVEGAAGGERSRRVRWILDFPGRAECENGSTRSRNLCCCIFLSHNLHFSFSGFCYF